ncbi:hypothetical protein GUJ93_ZPchr0006g43908 [Zizania palustris]|uniref:Uncharacterized protein n=1 Tax=Zizania palustris TaxID=103762 RepID=A0A8J5T5T2_ZIZPA|nr:hypothetical protein GUJ93_ZPchr0006g43908 [Zizania palustris]
MHRCSDEHDDCQFDNRTAASKGRHCQGQPGGEGGETRRDLRGGSYGQQQEGVVAICSISPSISRCIMHVFSFRAGCCYDLVVRHCDALAHHDGSFKNAAISDQPE